VVATNVSVPGCPFCEIIAGRLPSSDLYRDDRVAVFLDLRPITTGHLLVVPCSHASGLADLPEKTGEAMFATAQRMAAALRGSGVRCDGINFFLADGAAAGQEVAHVHLHVLPRFAGDGFTLSASFLSPDRSDLDATAELIRGALVDLAGSPTSSGA
jgi:diadenosine tetraphosphate (Ap4A) HIT family hydrolase